MPWIPLRGVATPESRRLTTAAPGSGQLGDPVFPFQHPPHPAKPVFVQHAGQLARAPAAMVRVPGLADPAEKEPTRRQHVGQRQDRRKGEGHGGPFLGEERVVRG